MSSWIKRALYFSFVVKRVKWCRGLDSFQSLLNKILSLDARKKDVVIPSNKYRMGGNGCNWLAGLASVGCLLDDSNNIRENEHLGVDDNDCDIIDAESSW